MKNSIKSFWQYLLPIAFLCACTTPIPLAPRQTVKTLHEKQIIAGIEEEMRLQNTPGLLLGVVRNGNIIHLRGYGEYDVERNIPMTLESELNWASISKTLTAVAAWQLNKQFPGSFDLDAPVDNYVEYWVEGNTPDAALKQKITSRQLLSHQSGMRQYNKERGDDVEYNKSAYSDVSNQWNAEQSIDVFRDLKLKSDPDSLEFRYSTFGYNLLGATIEEVAKKETNGRYGYYSWIKDKVLKRLNLKSIRPSSEDVPGYQIDCEAVLTQKTKKDARWVLPGGGWKSNIADLTGFMKGLMDNSLVETDSLWSDINGRWGYGFGLKRESISGKAFWGHNGDHHNVMTKMAFTEDKSFGIALMINADYGNRNRFVQRVMAALSLGNPISNDYILNCGSGDLYTSKIKQSPGFLEDWHKYAPLVGDVNGDGKEDLIWNKLEGNTNQVKVGLGSSTGRIHFQNEQTHPGRGWHNYPKAKLGDFNRDQRADLVWIKIMPDRSARISIALGQANGSFHFIDDSFLPPNSFTHSSYNILIGDVNKDQRDDLIFNKLTSVSNVIQVALTQANLSRFILRRKQVIENRGWSDYTVLAKDINEDGRMDLVWNKLKERNQTIIAFAQANATYDLLDVQTFPAANSNWDDFQFFCGNINANSTPDFLWNKIEGNFNTTYWATLNQAGKIRFGRSSQEVANWQGFQTHAGNTDTKKILIANRLSSSNELTVSNYSKVKPIGQPLREGVSWSALQEHPKENWNGYRLYLADINGDQKDDFVWNKLSNQNLVFVGLAK